jgi:predicted aconitase
MLLNVKERAILEGKEGETKQKVMKTLIQYGDIFGADKMVPVSGSGGHLVTSFGLSVLQPVYELFDQLIEGGALSTEPFTVDPRPLDRNVPASILQNLVFKLMYSKQGDYEGQLKKLGLLKPDAFTCTCYLDEVGNTPKKGDVLSWAESSAVVYANSVLGARCNRNSGIFELFGSIVGCVPNFGLLTEEGRKASWEIIIKTTKIPEAQILGSAIGLKVQEEVPFITGLSQYFPEGLDDRSKSYLKDMGAATASNGSVGLYHVQNLTPEAVEQDRALLKSEAKTYVIDDAELERVKASYPCIWKDPKATPKLCFLGCPHCSYSQLLRWTEVIEAELGKQGKKKVAVKTVITAAPEVVARFKTTGQYLTLTKLGVVISSICPLMYMNNPLCRSMPVITNSNKLRTYSSARYHTDDEILSILTKGKV